MGEHDCISEDVTCAGEWWDCCNGALYGPCEDDHCGGVCEFKGDCRCGCHLAKRGEAAPEAGT